MWDSIIREKTRTDFFAAVHVRGVGCFLYGNLGYGTRQILACPHLGGGEPGAISMFVPRNDDKNLVRISYGDDSSLL